MDNPLNLGRLERETGTIAYFLRSIRWRCSSKLSTEVASVSRQYAQILGQTLRAGQSRKYLIEVSNPVCVLKFTH
jgi:hypothetical protein